MSCSRPPACWHRDFRCALAVSSLRPRFGPAIQVEMEPPIHHVILPPIFVDRTWGPGHRQHFAKISTFRFPPDLVMQLMLLAYMCVRRVAEPSIGPAGGQRRRPRRGGAWPKLGTGSGPEGLGQPKHWSHGAGHPSPRLCISPSSASILQRALERCWPRLLAAGQGGPHCPPSLWEAWLPACVWHASCCARSRRTRAAGTGSGPQARMPRDSDSHGRECARSAITRVAPV
jgi:hypothetical protein